MNEPRPFSDCRESRLAHVSILVAATVIAGCSSSDPSHDSTPQGGAAVSTSGGRSAGGTVANGGASLTDGATRAGGSATGGAEGLGGHTTAGQSSAICTASSYPAPSLNGTATLVTTGASGGQTEGVLWLVGSGALLFTEMTMSVSSTTVVPAKVGQLVPPNTVSTAVADSGTNGLAVDPSGNILGCSQKVQGIVSLNLATGTATTIINTDASGHHFNSPNDLTVRSDGTIYFTDPDYQIAGRTSETGTKGIYRLAPTNQVSVVDSQFVQPNGITLSPDETMLYVADTSASRIRRFAVAADGTTSQKQDFATVPAPDGGAIDCAGNLYWASNAAPGKIYVISPAGTQLGTISVGATDKPTNVAFGGADHQTLYISTSPSKVYAYALNVPGMPY